jgi:hypothetical protein
VEIERAGPFPEVHRLWGDEFHFSRTLRLQPGDRDEVQCARRVGCAAKQQPALRGTDHERGIRRDGTGENLAAIGIDAGRVIDRRHHRPARAAELIHFPDEFRDGSARRPFRPDAEQSI